jgi:Arc/MetJ family transcription regulator
MATNLALEDKLIEQAVKLGKHKTKKEAVTTALEDYIKARLREGINELVGQVEFHEGFDHKALRRRRRNA